MEEIKINMENLSQEEREYYLKLAEKGQKPVEREWPQEGDDYYFLACDDYIGEESWYGDELDCFLYDVGNCFHTEEEAEWYREHLKVCAELRRMADGKVKDGVWVELNYNIEGGVSALRYCKFQACPYIFATRESAKKAIDTIGEERLKKYWFRVED